MNQNKKINIQKYKNNKRFKEKKIYIYLHYQINLFIYVLYKTNQYKLIYKSLFLLKFAI